MLDVQDNDILNDQADRNPPASLQRRVRRTGPELALGPGHLRRPARPRPGRRCVRTWKEQSHLLRAYDAEFLTDAILAAKTRRQRAFAACPPRTVPSFNWADARWAKWARHLAQGSAAATQGSFGNAAAENVLANK